MTTAKGVHDILTLTRENEDYRRVVATGATSQLVLMTVQPGSRIDREVHDDTDQLIIVVEGVADVTLDGDTHRVQAGQLAYIPAGTTHEVRNTGGDALKLYTIYAPPEHPDGTVHATKDEADAYEREHHGD